MLRDQTGELLPHQDWDQVWSKYVPYYVPFWTAVALGLIPGYGRATGLGLNPDVDIATVPEDAWEGGSLFNWIITPVQCQIRSTSSNDSAAGTGARTIGVATLDSNLAPEFLNARGMPESRTLSLNGTTPVQLPAVIGASNGLLVLTAGSGETNDGDIILEDTVGGIVRGIIKAGQGFAHQAPYVVPAGYQLIVPQLLISVNKPNGVNPQSVQIRTYFKGPGAGAARLTLPLGASSAVPYPHELDPPLMAAEKTRFSVRITEVAADNASVTAAWNGALRLIAAP
jgi:hypothetical protein